MKWFNRVFDVIAVFFLMTLVVVNAAHTVGSPALHLVMDTVSLAIIVRTYYDRGRERGRQEVDPKL